MMLPVLNLNEATFDCTFGRGCDGVCCRNGRPPIYPDEQVILDANLSRILPALRPEARALVEARGYVSRRVKAGLHTLRVINGWCVFFNRGCVLHRMGAAEGNKFRYKPSICAIFPLGKDEHNQPAWQCAGSVTCDVTESGQGPMAYTNPLSGVIDRIGNIALVSIEDLNDDGEWIQL